MDVDEMKKWNVFPYYKIPIEYYSETGEIHTIGWIVTNDVDKLRDEQEKNQELLIR